MLHYICAVYVLVLYLGSREREWVAFRCICNFICLCICISLHLWLYVYLYLHHVAFEIACVFVFALCCIWGSRGQEWAGMEGKVGQCDGGAGWNLYLTSPACRTTLYVYSNISVYIWIYLYISVYLYICIYVCLYICIFWLRGVSYHFIYWNIYLDTSLDFYVDISIYLSFYAWVSHHWYIWPKICANLNLNI